MSAEREPPVLLDVAGTLAGKRILFIGATGFVGKVSLSVLLRHYPDIGKVFVLVRPGAGSSSEERFFEKVVSSPPFDPIREVWGAGAEAFLREKCVPLAGDVARPLLNFSEDDLRRLEPLDLIINCAGLVSFNPSLETALKINVLGPRHTIEVARRTGARVVHVSTCFVAGNRDGEIWEDEPVLGYFPRKGSLRDDDFSVEAEIADCQRTIDQVKTRADDRAHVSEFRDRGAARLLAEGRDADDERTLKIAVQRERKIWVNEKLTDLGMERAQHWGWPNTYTYTKSLGDQVCAQAAATGELRVCIVRPAIVESALRYPFPGWNEGFTTTAPLAFLNIKGHRNYPVGDKVILDVIPVDLVASGLVMAIAATLAGQNELVYQLGSSDVNPFYLKRTVELLGLHKRAYFQARTARGEGSALINRVLSRLEPVAVSRDRYNQRSAPVWKRFADGLTELIDERTPRWGAPRLAGMAEHAKEKLGQISALAGQTDELFQLFMPFIHERRYTFRCDHTRALHARLSPVDRQALHWDPEKIEWRDYWLKLHMPGLEKWVFPSLEQEFAARPKSVYTYRDLVEMFDATTKHHRSRTAMRLLPEAKGKEPIRYSYADLQDAAARVAALLRERGVAPRDRVMLVSENRPEWGIVYFGILKAGAVVVPVDWQAGAEEVGNLARWSGARLVVWSKRVAARLASEPAFGVGVGVGEHLDIQNLVESEPRSAPAALVHHARADEIASIIFTSGTTGRPKGVMLSHRNFSSLLSKLAAVFDLDKHDGLLSVLPLHHTFEFTAGLLMPLMRGAHINYLEELNADAMGAAFARGDITGMVGVPALWQLLHRRIEKQLAERGPWSVHLFEQLVEGCLRLRDRVPPALDQSVLNFAKILFWPIHARFGGRLRLLISGGSALPLESARAFRGLGFNLYEGYGLTEASPVLTVARPGKRIELGSVGEPLPGIDVQIAAPDEQGIGEIIASGPSIMAGYFEHPEATAAVLRDGWLHTGDLGRFDASRRLYVVGRKKEMILGSSGENVYPDELEELYRDSPDIKELSVVGISDGAGGETVACLIVPEYREGELREAVRERLSDHIKNVSVKLPLYKRIKVFHLTDLELPKTPTRKVKRALVANEVVKLEQLRKQAEEARQNSSDGGGPDGRGQRWIRELIASVSQRPAERVLATTRLEELGFDSLLFTELQVALEAAGVAIPSPSELMSIATVGELEARAPAWMGTRRKGESTAKPRSGDAQEIKVPEMVAEVGRAALTRLQRMTYEQLFDTEVTGRAQVPQTEIFLIAANHASHLDMGLVKHAIGAWGPRLVALAAKDYFFEDPIRRAYFENFTNLVPMDRHGSLRESLRLAQEVVRSGYILLLFPEGTRSTTGVMQEFKPVVGYLALTSKIGVLPMYLQGTHDALPKGALLPKHRDIAAHIGPLLSYETLHRATEGLSRAEAYRAASQIVERAVRQLAPEGSINRGPAPPAPAARLTAASVMTRVGKEELP